MANTCSGFRGLLPVIGLASGLLMSPCTHAQMIACSSPGGAASYKIFVDEVKTASGAAPSAEVLKSLSALRDFVVSDLTTLSAGQASIRRCNARFPTDAGDFDDTEVSSLDNLRVLLEVWGVAEDAASGRGMLGFVLVPARQLAPPAVYMIRRDGPDFLTQAKLGTELRVFAPLAYGIRAYRNQHYEESVPPLCQGMQELDALLKTPAKPAEAPLRADEKVLLLAVKKIVSDAITKSRAITGSRFVLLKPAADGQFSCPRV